MVYTDRKENCNYFIKWLQIINELVNDSLRTPFCRGPLFAVYTGFRGFDPLPRLLESIQGSLLGSNIVRLANNYSPIEHEYYCLATKF